jgi:hypothetical protein
MKKQETGRGKDGETGRLGAKLIGYSMALCMSFGWSSSILAQSTSVPGASPEICDVNLALLKSTDPRKDPNIVTADTVTPEGMTVPSLWWTNEQFPAKLVTNWIANRSENQIYLLVNSQYWNILDYIDRYRTIDRFGRVAQGYGYNLKICTSQKIALAGYTCGSIAQHPAEIKHTPTIIHESDGARDGNNCQIWFGANGQNGLGVIAK